MSTIYSKSQFSTAFDDLKVGPYTNLVGTLGGYVYKSDNPFKAHIKNFIEPNAGAHYYVHSQYSSSYQSASMTVNLNEISVNTKNPSGKQTRRGFICLAILTEGTKLTQCDIGLASDGSGWYPYSWGANNSPSSQSGMGIIISGTPTITVRIDVKSGDSFTGTFLNGTSEIAKVTYTGTAGQFFKSSGGKPLTRFNRFMSLVPFSRDTDDKDSTTLNGTIRNCKLGTTDWTATQIQYAWSVQGANIEDLQISNLAINSVATNADRIKINHRYQLT